MVNPAALNPAKAQKAVRVQISGSPPIPWRDRETANPAASKPAKSARTCEFKSRSLLHSLDTKLNWSSTSLSMKRKPVRSRPCPPYRRTRSGSSGEFFKLLQAGSSPVDGSNLMLLSANGQAAVFSTRSCAVQIRPGAPRSLSSVVERRVDNARAIGSNPIETTMRD